MADLTAEVWSVLRTPKNGPPDSCFVSNEALSGLKQYGAALLPAVERVLRSEEYERERSDKDSWASFNEFGLLLLYFKQAADHGQDATQFVHSLRGRLHHEALVAVWNVWSPWNRNGWREMPAGLFQAWYDLTGEDKHLREQREWMVQAVRNGDLTLTEGSQAIPG